MEHSGVNPSAAGGCKVEDPLGPLTRSQVDVTELCQRIPEGNSRLAPSVPDSVKSTCDGLGSSGYQQLSLKNMTTKLFELFIGG